MVSVSERVTIVLIAHLRMHSRSSVMLFGRNSYLIVFPRLDRGRKKALHGVLFSCSCAMIPLFFPFIALFPFVSFLGLPREGGRAWGDELELAGL